MVKNTVVKEVVKVVDEVSRMSFKKKGLKLKKSKRKYIILITIKDGNSRTLKGIKKIKADITHLKLGDKEFLFDIEKDIYTTGLKSYYLIDLNKGQLHLDLGDTYKFNPKSLKKLVRDQVIAQSITRFTNQQNKVNFFVAVFFSIFGGLIGYLICLYSMGVV